MIDETARVAVVGAGHGGATVAALLRQSGFAGAIAIYGAEPHLPYQRPPLSKAGVHHGPDLLRPAVFYNDQNIELCLRVPAHALDAAGSKLELADGRHVGYDVAVLAAGARPRRMLVAGAGLKGVHTLRTIDDAQALRGELGPGRRLVIIGGGYIGLEIAAVARERGAEVVILEGSDRILNRSAGPDIAKWISNEHQSRGTRISTRVAVTGFGAGSEGSVTAVHTIDGDVPCDLVLLGIGAEPCEELARDAGLLCDGGVVVDTRARTSADGVYAVGDMTRRPVPPYPGLYRLESIPSTGEQAKQAVSDILGKSAPRPEVPWFWSDQFHLKLQIAGLPALAEASVVRGDPALGRFAVYHFAADQRVLAVEAVNAPNDFMAGKKWIAARVSVDVDAVADATRSLRTLVRSGES